MVAKKVPSVEIHYCTRCRFVLRATWLAQELLMTFGETIGQLVLVPTSDGKFSVYCNDLEVFDRKKAGRFPESKELKQLIRDQIDPEKDLGHSDKS